MSGALSASDDACLLLLLDVNARCLRGVSTQPLLTGELKLLQQLGSRPHAWHSARWLAERVFQRDDPAAIQLVWKYASTLRRKLALAPVKVIETCRMRGYRCSPEVRIVVERGGAG